MSLITIIPKQNPSQSINIDQNEVSLNDPAILTLNIKKEDIASSVYDGSSLVVTLKNGEKIVLKDFVDGTGNSPHTIVLSGDPQNLVQIQVNETGQITDYLGNINLNNLIANAQPDLVVETINENSKGFSLADFLENNGSNVGLGIASVLGVGPLLFKSEKENKGAQPPDTTKPDAAVATISEDGKKISGTAEANATVILLDSAKTVVATAQVGKDGKYVIEIPADSQTGQVIGVYVEDAAGNVSEPTSITSIDNVVPIISTAQMNEQGNNVVGKTEAESNVSLYDKDGKLLGTARSNAAGEFSILLSTPLTNGADAYVVAEDKAKNSSEKYSVSPGKDTTPPVNPTGLEVSNNGTLLKGQVEPNAAVELKNIKGEVIGKGQADANGKFSIDISPAIVKDEGAKLYLTDSLGNTSQPVKVNFDTDNLPPESPAATLNKEGTEVTGNAEIGSTVMIKTADNKTVLGTAKVDENGQYKITLEKALTDNVKVNVIAQDASNNDSTAFVLEGTDVDTIAPTVATITQIKDDVGSLKGAVKQDAETDDAQPTFIGKGESGATVTIYDKDNLIGSVKVDAQGNWEFTPQQPLSLGEHSITLYQTDSSNNMSLVSSKYTFKVVEETSASALPTSDDSSVIDNVITDAILTTNGENQAESIDRDTEVDSSIPTFDGSNYQRQDPYNLEQQGSIF